MQAQSAIDSRAAANARGVNPGAEASQSGYAVYNAMVNYRFNDNYSLQLNANNIFDRKYYRQVAPTPTGYYWGDPRNVSVTLRGTF